MPNYFLHTHISRVSFLQRLLDSFLIFFIYWVIKVIFFNTWESIHFVAAIVSVAFFLIIAELRGLYRSWRTSSMHDEINTLFYTWASVVFFLLIYVFMTKTAEDYSRTAVLIWWFLVPITLTMMRLLIRQILKQSRQQGKNIRKVAVVGNNHIGFRLVNQLEHMPWAGLVINAIFDFNHTSASTVKIGMRTYPLHSVETLIAKVHAGEIDSVYIAMPLHHEHHITELVDALADTTASVFILPDLFIFELTHARWIDFGGLPLISVYETPFNSLYGWVKRAEDVLVASLILMFISPLLLLIAVAVKLTSPGPILFKQNRYGLNGAIVEVWKFRSMTVCENGDIINQAQKNDTRITPLGAFLRKNSLDELPQFFNVLQGSMSIVGPRPHAIAHNEEYRKLIKGYMLRHKVKPGITGWAQINGWRGETDTLEKMEKRVEYDLQYIQNWSLWLDIKIIFLTMFKGFSGTNVY